MWLDEETHSIINKVKASDKSDCYVVLCLLHQVVPPWCRCFVGLWSFGSFGLALGGLNLHFLLIQSCTLMVTSCSCIHARVSVDILAQVKRNTTLCLVPKPKRRLS